MITDFASLAEHARVVDFARGDALSVHTRFVARAVRVAAAADCGRGRGAGSKDGVEGRGRGAGSRGGVKGKREWWKRRK